MGEFSGAEQDTILTIILVAAAISLLGACFILLMFACYKKLRTFAYRLIFTLALFDAGSAIFTLLSIFSLSGSLCQIQAWGISFFGLATVLWVLVIAWTLYKTSIGSLSYVQVHHKWYLLIVIGVSSIASFLPMLTSSYAESSTEYCWISEQTDRAVALTWQMITFYIPLWGIFIVSSLCYYKTVKVMKTLIRNLGELDGQERMKRLKTLYRLRYFPLVLILAWFFGSVNRIYLFFEHDNPSVLLTVLHTGLGNLLGAYNCLVYGLNTQVMSTLADSAGKCFPCIKQESAAEMVPQGV